MQHSASELAPAPAPAPELSPEQKEMVKLFEGEDIGCPLRTFETMMSHQPSIEKWLARLHDAATISAELARSRSASTSVDVLQTDAFRDHVSKTLQSYETLKKLFGAPPKEKEKEKVAETPPRANANANASVSVSVDAAMAALAPAPAPAPPAPPAAPRKKKAKRANVVALALAQRDGDGDGDDEAGEVVGAATSAGTDEFVD